MAFDDLDEALEEQDGEAAESEADSTDTDSSQTDSKPAPAASDDGHSPRSRSTTASTTQEAPRDSSTEATPDPAQSGPAFPYDQVKQGPIYPRESTWDTFEEAVAVELTPQLYQEDVKDVEKREIHDAVLQLAADNVDELAETILEARREG